MADSRVRFERAPASRARERSVGVVPRVDAQRLGSGAAVGVEQIEVGDPVPLELGGDAPVCSSIG